MATQKQTNGGMNSVRDDIRSLKDDISNLVKGIMDDGIGRVLHARDKVVGRAGHAIEVAESTVKTRPLATIAAAFGLGMMIGRFALGRRG